MKLDKDTVFSEAVKAGKRTYFFDIKRSHNGDRYVTITESKRVGDGFGESANYEKHKIFLYPEDFEKFRDALERTTDMADKQNEEKGGTVHNRQRRSATSSDEQQPSTSFIDIDF